MLRSKNNQTLRHKLAGVEKAGVLRPRVGWKDIFAGIFIPLMAAFPWIVEIFVAPVPKIQNIFLPYGGYAYSWIWLAFCYLAYFFLHGKGRILFNVFAYASSLAFLLALALALFLGEEYPAYCMDFLNSYFEWGREGCVIENFLFLFIACLFIQGFFINILKRVNARKHG